MLSLLCPWDIKWQFQEMGRGGGLEPRIQSPRCGGPRSQKSKRGQIGRVCGQEGESVDRDKKRAHRRKW